MKHKYSFAILQYHTIFGVFEPNIWWERQILIVKDCWQGQYLSPTCIPLCWHVLYGQTGIIYWFGSTVAIFIHHISFLYLLAWWSTNNKKKLKEKKNLWCCSAKDQRKNLPPHFNCSSQCLFICSESWSLGSHCFLLPCVCSPVGRPHLWYFYLSDELKKKELIYLDKDPSDEIGKCVISFRTQTKTFIFKSIQVLMKRIIAFFNIWNGQIYIYSDTK